MIHVVYRGHANLLVVCLVHLAQVVVKAARTQKESAMHQDATLELIAQAVLNDQLQRFFIPQIGFNDLTASVQGTISQSQIGFENAVFHKKRHVGGCQSLLNHFIDHQLL